MKHRSLRLDVNLAKAALQDKQSSETLAFCLILKLYNRASTFPHYDLKQLQATFGIGFYKLRAIIQDGIQKGMLKVDNSGSLTAAKVHDNKGWSIKIPAKWFTEKSKRVYNKITGKYEKRISIAAMIDIIRMAVLYNHIQIQKNCAETHDKATSPLSIDEMRTARKRESRLLRKGYSDEYRGLSYQRIMEILNSKYDKCLAIVESLVKLKAIKKQLRWLNLGDLPEKMTKAAITYLNKDGYRYAPSIFSRTLFIVKSNIYTPCLSLVSKSNNGR